MEFLTWFWNAGELLMIIGVGIIIIGLLLEIMGYYGIVIGLSLDYYWISIGCLLEIIGLLLDYYWFY